MSSTTSTRVVVPFDPMVRASASVQSMAVVAARRLARLRADDRGQATAEYALVILGAAAVAALLMAWAGQTNRVGRLLDAVLDNVIKRFR